MNVLEVPRDLYDDIATLAAVDMRKVKPELIWLLREAVELRKLRDAGTRA